jgi:hypothetical protein
MLTRRLLDLTIPKRASNCCECEKIFEAGTPVFSLLREAEEVVREDRCATCWEQVGESDEVWSSWQGKMPVEKKAKLKEMNLSGKERALALLRDHLEESALAKAFLLALYLERRGVLVRCRELKRKSGHVRLYEVEGTGEAIYVPRQEFVPRQEQMQAELLQSLRGDA